MHDGPIVQDQGTACRQWHSIPACANLSSPAARVRSTQAHMPNVPAGFKQVAGMMPNIAGQAGFCPCWSQLCEDHGCVNLRAASCELLVHQNICHVVCEARVCEACCFVDKSKTGQRHTLSSTAPRQPCCKCRQGSHHHPHRSPAHLWLSACECNLTSRVCALSTAISCLPADPSYLYEDGLCCCSTDNVPSTVLPCPASLKRMPA